MGLFYIECCEMLPSVYRVVRICGYCTLVTVLMFACLPIVTMFNIFPPLDVFRNVKSAAAYSSGDAQPEGFGGGKHRRQTECDVSLCEYTEWSDWSFCYCAICNELESTTRRSCLRFRTVAATPDGCEDEDCESDAIGDLQCFEECCNTHCGVTEWSDWLSCNDTCSQYGVQSRTRSPYPNECFVTCTFQETRPCDGYCETGEWSEWGCFCDVCEPDYYDINETITEPLIYDGNETLHRNCTRNRTATTPDLCEGCDLIAFEENVCMENCSCDSSSSCSVDDWGTWSDCPINCGGSQIRTRTYSSDCTAPPCDGTRQSRACTACPACTPCEYSEWGEWNVLPCSLCDNTELSNVETRTQTALDAVCDEECPEVQDVQCGDACCDEFCWLSDWTEWSECPESCGGFQARTRDPMFCLGEPCTATEETMECPTCSGCDVCDISEWTSWACSCQLCDPADTELTNQCVRTRVALDDCDTSCFTSTEIQCDTKTLCCDALCLPDEWSEWSACPEPCGGTSNRTRQYSTTCLGDPCEIENLFESQDCPTCPECPPVDCIVTQWSEWSQCDNSCGIGTQSRSRAITVDAECDGNECPSIEELEESSVCEGECQLSEWGSWGCTCSVCSGFVDSLYTVCTRQRDVAGPSSCSSADCATAFETDGCTDKCCDSLCSVSEWSSWSACSSGCGSGQAGIQNRTRTSDEVFCIGEPCDSLYEEMSCTPDACCAVDCVATQWSDWSACSVSCSSESGTQTRDREVTQGTCGGVLCTETDTIETQECTGECQLLEWSTWSCLCWFCSTGDDFFSNVCSRDRQEIGTDCNSQCGSLSETVCNDVCCDAHCITTEWSTWSSCDQPCGSTIPGNETRTRSYDSTFCIGEPCDPLTETQSCDPGCCAVDCSFSEWSEWSECSVVCADDTGSRSRSRDIQELQCGGASCENEITTETEECQGECTLSIWSEWDCSCSQCVTDDNAEYEYCTRTRTASNEIACGNACGDLIEEECRDKCCDPNCDVSDWSEWTECNVPCESSSLGISQRSRTAIGTCSAEPCVSLVETTTCEASCCATDCALLSWEEWTSCTSLCSNRAGIQTRTRPIVQGSCGGNICTESDYTETSSCYGACDVSEWSDWSCVCGICTADILQEICIRNRNQSTDVNCSGQCGESSEAMCGISCCDELCLVGEWSQWTDCSEPCGSVNAGSQTRERNVTSQTCRGEPCDQLSETRQCFQGSGCCPVDCELGVWSTWSGCSAQCLSDAGNETRTRDIITQDSCGGKLCDDSNILEYKLCYGSTFPANCIEGTWATWSPCALENGACGTGIRQRTREVISQPVCGGLSCGQASEFEVCQGPCCPVDCGTTSWTDWTECSTECGTGQQMRFRMITIASECGGIPCTETFQRRECTGVGPSVCEFTDWSEWTSCSSSCGLGGQTRRRAILTPSNCRDQCVSAVTEQNQGCERFVNTDCQLGDWTPWSSCVPDCVGFTKARSRDVIVYNSCNGEVCPSLTESTNCNIFCQHACSGNGQCSCNPGYQLTGSLATECTSVTCPAPVFHSSTCPISLSTSCIPPTASCGAGTSYEYNHICQLSCESRSGYTYQLVGPGPGYTQCLVTGQWSYYSEAYCTIVNTPPTGLTAFSGNTIIVEENTFGNVLAVLRTEDVDSAWETYTYTVIDDVYNIINIIDNQIYLRHALDYELQERYTVTLRSTDSAGNWVDQEFTFQVSDANDPPSGVTISNDKVAENSIVNTAVGLLQAVDQDTGQSYTYSLVDDANGRFSISGNLLQTAMTDSECQQLFNDACFNYDTQQYHDVIVSIQDSGNPAMVEYHTLRIYVQNAIEQPAGLLLSSNVIQESFTSGTVIGVVSVDVTDPNYRYVYSLLNDYSGLFRIDTSTGALILEDSTRIDYAAQQSYTIQVNAVDPNNPTNMIIENIVLDVTPGNSPSTSVTILSTTGSGSYPVNEPVIQAGTQSGEVFGAVVVYDYVENGDVTIDVEGGNGLYQTRRLHCSPVNGHELGYRTVCLYDLYVTSDVTSQSQGSVITLISTNSIGQTTRHAYNIDVASSVDDSTNAEVTARATTPPTTHATPTPTPPLLVFSGDSSPSESLSSNTPIGSITTTDFSNQYTYTIVDDRDGIFQLQGNFLYLSPDAQLDYETASEHEVTIRAVQNGDPSNTVQMTFRFQVEDTNEAPTSVHFSSTQVAFGAPVGSSVATISVSDPDNTAGTHQDSQCYITGDDSGVFAIYGHSLETTKALIPGQSTYFLQVRCVDSGTPAMYVDSQVVIDVLVDDPIDIGIVLTDYTPLSENVEPSSIGKFHVINAATGQQITDVDFSYFMLFMGGEVPLTVKDDQLWTTSPLDYEQLSNFDVTIHATGTDSYGRELTAAQVFQIDVLDVWEAPTSINVETTETQISTENQIGDVIGTLGTTGEDTDYSDIVYTITSVRTGSSDIVDPNLADLVTVDGNVLRMGEGIEYVTFDGNSEQYVIHITARSTSNPDWSAEIAQEIEVFKVNHPPTDITIDNALIMEDVATGSHIGYLSIIDPDTDDIASCHVLNRDDVPFDIIDSNELVTTGPLDFELFYIYSVQVQCSDSDGLSVTKTLEISVDNVLEAPTFLSLSNVEVREDTYEGETVGLLYSLVEQGHWVRYRVVQDDVPFEIAGNNTLVITDTVDFEDVSRYDITVAAELGDDPSLVTYANFSILIQNLNDPPAAILLDPSSFSIPESAVDGTAVGSFNTIDEDEGQLHEYRILSDIQSTGAFAIEGNQLILVDSTALDFETHQYIELLIETVDDGDPSKSFQEIVRVRVIDTGEPPKDIIYQTPTLPENSPAGTLVTRLLVDDPDKNEDHTCSVIRTDTDSDLFDITRTSNNDIRLVVADGADVDYETRPYHRVEVECGDGYNFIRKTITVFIDDINEPPEGIDLSGSHSVPIDADTGYVIGQLQVHDPDTDQEHVISVSGETSDIFKVDGNSLILAQPLQEEMIDSSDPFLQVILKVVDNGPNMLSRTQAYTVAITGLNDFNLDGNEVSELSLPDHQIGRFTSDLGSFAPQYRLVDDSDGRFSLTDDYILALADVVDYAENPYLFIEGEMQSEDVKMTRIFRVTVFPEDPCSTGYAQCLPYSSCARLSKTEFECVCHPGYDDIDRQCFAVDDCATLNGNPCMYNAPCIDDDNSFRCVCPAGYQGKLCEVKPVDPCQSQPCLNNGACFYSSDYMHYFCQCLTGFTGENCQNGVDDQPLCNDVDCGAGECFQSGDDVACQCPSSYYGMKCQYVFDVCSDSVCESDEYCIPHIRASNGIICAPQSESVDVSFLNENLGSDSTDPFVQSKFNTFVESTEQLPDLYVLFASNTPTNESIMVFFIVNEAATDVLEHDYVSCVLYDECSGSGAMEEFCPDILDQFVSLCGREPVIEAEPGSNLWIILCTLGIAFCLLILLIVIAYRRCSKRNSVIHTFEPIITKQEGIRYISQLHSITGSSKNNTIAETRLTGDYEYFTDNARHPSRLFRRSLFPSGMENARSQSDSQLTHLYANREESQNRL